MRDMPTHYKLITPPFIKFHDRCLLRQRALYTSRRSLALAHPACTSSSLADTYINYLREFTIPLMGIGVIGHPSVPLRALAHPSVSPRDPSHPLSPSYNRPPRCSTPLSRSLLIMFHPAFENPRDARQNRKWLRCSAFRGPS